MVFFRVFICQRLLSTFLLLDCRLFAFILYCFAVRVWEWSGNKPVQWEFDGNRNEIYTFKLGSVSGKEWELSAWKSDGRNQFSVISILGMPDSDGCDRFQRTWEVVHGPIEAGGLGQCEQRSHSLLRFILTSIMGRETSRITLSGRIPEFALGGVPSPPPLPLRSRV